MNSWLNNLTGVHGCRCFCLLVAATSVLLQISCARPAQTQVDIKSLSLNPDRFIGTHVKIKGQVKGIGPADSYLLVEDATGRIMVGTEQVAQKIGCPDASKVELVGTLRRLKNLPQPYFSMEKLVHCGP